MEGTFYLKLNHRPRLLITNPAIVGEESRPGGVWFNMYP